MTIFTVENGDRKYIEVFRTENADAAIYSFIEGCDLPGNVRLLRNGEVMARQTAKSTYLHPDWR